MSIFDALSTHCIECFKFFFPITEQQNIHIMSDDSTIETIHHATACIMKEFSEREPYDCRTMYLRAYPSTDSLLNESDVSASPIQQSRFVESPLFLANEEVSPLVKLNKSNSFLSLSENRSLLIRENAKKITKIASDSLPISKPIPSVIATEVIPLEIRDVQTSNNRDFRENLYSQDSSNTFIHDIEETAEIYPITYPPYYTGFTGGSTIYSMYLSP